MVSCPTCGFVLKSELCLDAHVNQLICSFYTQSSGCSLTISKQSVSTHQCSKKRCTICSQFFEFGKNSKHDCFVQKPKNGKRANSDAVKSTDDIASKRLKISERLSSDVIVSGNLEVPDCDIFVFDIETDQSCKFNNEHRPVLLISKSLTSVEGVHNGYDCIEKFCKSIFAEKKTECESVNG